MSGVVAEPNAQPKSAGGSAWAILASNAITMAFAWFQHWDLRPLMVIYWCQSIIIGGFNFARMIKLRQFSTEGLKSNGQPVPETAKGKWSTAIFFAIHYGFFHVGYLVFLLIEVGGGSPRDRFGGPWEPSTIDLFLIGAGIFSFLVGHGISFRKNVEADLAGRPNLGTMMFLPYARIIPMHLTIIFGFWFGSQRGAVMLFMTLKTVADLIMHHVEHRVMQKQSASRAGRGSR
ncbi:MAG: DUF6498-containing protein [Planctomycetota bacterium]